MTKKPQSADPPYPFWRQEVHGIPGHTGLFEPPDLDEPEPSVRLRAEIETMPDWVDEDTMIVHQPIIRFRSAREAMAWFGAKYGRVLQNCTCARFWAARVRRVPRP